MRITELIELLIEIKEDHGDIPIMSDEYQQEYTAPYLHIPDEEEREEGEVVCLYF